MMIDLNNVKRVHFIGIAGAGMRAIANIFIEKGYDVSAPIKVVADDGAI